PPQTPLFPYTTLFRSLKHLSAREFHNDLLTVKTGAVIVGGCEVRPVEDGVFHTPSCLKRVCRSRSQSSHGHASAHDTHEKNRTRSEEHTSELQSRGHL